MNELILFFSCAASVFALGFQSQNVNQGHYWSAAATSLVIGGSTIWLYKKLPDADTLGTIAYLVGGVSGITASMWVHRRTLGRKRG